MLIYKHDSSLPVIFLYMPYVFKKDTQKHFLFPSLFFIKGVDFQDKFESVVNKEE